MRDFDPTASEYISSGFIEKSRLGGVFYDPATIAIGNAIAGPASSALLGSSASGDASAAQAQAAAKSDATQRYFYDTTRADNAPFRDTGVAANNRLAYLMGLGGAGGGSNTGLNADQLRSQLQSQFTTSTGGGQPMYDPNSNYEKGIGWANGMQIPTGFSQGTSTVDETGLQAAINQRMQQQQAQQTAQANDPSFGSLSRNFAASDMNADPVYQSGLQFGLDEGTKGINRQAASSGSMLSGATLKALTRFGNDYGSTKANESYNRFNTNQNQQYNRLASLSGAGQQATNQVSAAGMNTGNNISASQQGLGNAQGASYIAQGNALQNGINGSVAALRSNSSGYANSPIYDNGYGSGTGPSYNGNYSRM